MENEQIFEQQGTVYPPEPHFDEERTLLSARPVVPLRELKTKTLSGNGLFLIAGVALALVLGSCTAILLVHFEKQREESPVAVGSRGANVQQSEGSGEQIGGSPSVVVDKTSETPPIDQSGAKQHELGKVAAAQKTNVPGKRRVPGHDPEFPVEGRLSNTEAAGEAAPLSNGETRRERHWEERRLRRAAWRERRDNNRDPDADLFRIREIFEGRRAPN